jgi:hypothetical protein
MAFDSAAEDLRRACFINGRRIGVVVPQGLKPLVFFGPFRHDLSRALIQSGFMKHALRNRLLFNDSCCDWRENSKGDRGADALRSKCSPWSPKAGDQGHPREATAAADARGLVPMKSHLLLGDAPQFSSIRVFSAWSFQPSAADAKQARNGRISPTSRARLMD